MKPKHGSSRVIFIFCLLWLLAGRAPAMDRWVALAMLESGGRDDVIGQAGEISRYQIRRELWAGGSRLDAQVALMNAQRIMNARVSAFQQAHGRSPTDFEFYILWNAPAQINHPHYVVVQRARRFINLLTDNDTT